ncbi:MAG: VOC family protein [Pseudomonadota bacterium]
MEPTPDPQEIRELKAFVPARDYELSKRFYQAIGFQLQSDGSDVSLFQRGGATFLLQNFYVETHASNFMMHLLVENVDAWHEALVAAKVVEQFGVSLLPIETQPWGMRDFVLTDPSGVLWRIAEQIDAR